MDGCEQSVKARGLCAKHYSRWSRYGTTELPQRAPVRRSTRAACSQDGCTDQTVGRGLCRKHYARWERTGDPQGLRRELAPTTQCAREGCSETLKFYTKRPQKYCSAACYRQDASKREYRDRACQHCSDIYMPVGPSQRFCETCLGPAVKTSHGLRYPGAHRLQRYGVSQPDWIAMVAKFDGKCWICQEAPATALDHCHATGRVRGVLCDHCNTRLHVMEKAGWLEAAQAYLAAAESVVF